MIRLPYKMVIDADDNGFILSDVAIKGEKAKPDEVGNEYYVNPRYYATMGDVVQGILKRLSRRIVASGEVTTLNAFLERYNEITQEVKALLEGKTHV